MPSFPQQSELGLFIPTTGVRDQTLQGEEAIIAVRENINAIALALNAKDSGYYVLQEFINGQAWFPDPALSSSTASYPDLRQVFRLVVNFGTLPNTGTKTVVHGLTVTAGFTFTRIYGAATEPSTMFIPLPYASPVAADNIELWVDATKVSIKTGKDRTAFTTTYVILEYIKN